MLEDLSARRSNALVHEEMEQAERLRQTMLDCRDTALRSSHVDILFDRAEVSRITVAPWHRTLYGAKRDQVQILSELSCVSRLLKADL